MATRLYPNSGIDSKFASGDVAVAGTWNATSTDALDIRNIYKEKYFYNGYMYSEGQHSETETSATNNYDVLLGRFMSKPLLNNVSFTTSDTVSWVLAVKESSTDANMYYKVHITVVKPDGSVRGTLLSNNVGGTEWSTTFTGRGEGTKTLSAVSALAGDFILVEIGYRAVNTSTTSYTGDLYYGADNASTDLTQGTTQNGTQAGWIEFSNNFDFVDTIYWVGGSGSITDSAHWALTSGGTGGKAKISDIYNVVFDENSFTTNGNVVTVNMYVAVGSLDMTGVTKTVTIDGAIANYAFYIVGSYLRVNDFVTFGGTYSASLNGFRIGEMFLDETTLALKLGNNTHKIIELAIGNEENSYSSNNDMVVNFESNFYAPECVFSYYTVSSGPGLVINTNNYNITVAELDTYDDTVSHNFGTSTLTIPKIVWTDYGGGLDTEDAKLVLSSTATNAKYQLTDFTIRPHWAEVEVSSSLGVVYLRDISTDKLIIAEDVAVDVYNSISGRSLLGDVILQKNSVLLGDTTNQFDITSVNSYGTVTDPVIIGPWFNNTGSQYYADGHTSISDPNSVWTDDSNAANGNQANYAYTSTVGSYSSNYLEIQGTNIPSSANRIYAINVSVYAASTGAATVTYNLSVYDQNDVWLGSTNSTSVTGTTMSVKSIYVNVASATKPYYTASEIRNFKFKVWKVAGTAGVRIGRIKIEGIEPQATPANDSAYSFYFYNSTTSQSELYGAEIYNLVAGGNHLLGRENIEGGALPTTLALSKSGSTSYTLDTGSKVAGVYSIKHSASGAGNIYNGKVLGSDATELYVKYKVFLPSSFSVGSTGYVEIAHINNNSDTTSVYAELRNSSGNIRLYIKGDAITSIDTGINLTQNAVNNLQFYFKKSATVGAVKVWKDNDSVNSPDYNSGNINTGTVALRKVYFGKYYSPDANSDIWIDDLAISQSFILETPKFLAIDVITHSGDSGLDYLTSSEEDVTKTVDYEVLYMPEIQKTAQYTTIEDYSITKSGNYNIAIITSLDFVAGYEVISTPLQKTFAYKVYDSTGNFLNTWTDVISDFAFKQELNMVGSEATINLARKADDFGEGVDVAQNNRVEVYAIDKESPNGLLIFTGRVSAYTADYDSETVQVTLLSYGAELAEILVADGDGKTVIPLLSVDPSDVFRTIIDYYQLSGGTTIDYDVGSIDDTETTVSYTLNSYTAKEALDKALELTPVDWYFYLDLATNLIHLHEKGTTADHTFAIGRDVANLSIKKRSETIVNTVYFVGGDISGGVGDPVNFYKKYTIPASITQYGVRSKRVVDQRVKLESTADIIAQRYLMGSPEILVSITVIDSNQNSKGYDLETIKLGQLVKIGNSGIGPSSVYDEAEFDTSPYDYDPSNLSSIIFQVTSIEYTGDFITLSLSTTPPDITKRIQDINRNLVDLQTQNNPDTPDT